MKRKVGKTKSDMHKTTEKVLQKENRETRKIKKRLESATYVEIADTKIPKKHRFKKGSEKKIEMWEIL